jgi:hypothetical protein
MAFTNDELAMMVLKYHPAPSVTCLLTAHPHSPYAIRPRGEASAPPPLAPQLSVVLLLPSIHLPEKSSIEQPLMDLRFLFHLVRHSMLTKADISPLYVQPTDGNMP